MKDQIDFDVVKLIEALHQLQKHHRLYFSEQSPAVMTFMQGFNFALDVLGCRDSQYDQIYTKLRENSDWKTLNQHLAIDMLNQDLPMEQIIAQTIDLEIQTWNELMITYDK